MKKTILYISKMALWAFSFLVLLGGGLYFIPFPVGWHAKMASSHTDYFFQDEEQWLKEHNLKEAAIVKLTEFKLRHDVIGHLHDRLQLENKSDQESINIAANEVRKLYITQIQEEVPVISNSSAVSLIRGIGFCDQINAGLALLLEEKLDQVQLFGITNPPDNGKHTLIKSQSSLGTVWIDAFTCVNAFGFQDELSQEGKKHIPVYDEKAALLFEKEAYQEGFFFNEFSFGYSCKKAINRVKSLLIHKSYNPDQVMVMEKPDSLLAIDPAVQREMMQVLDMETGEAKEAYLQARVYQLFGEKDKALEYFAIAKEKSSGGLISLYATVFSRRLAGEEVLCRR